MRPPRFVAPGDSLTEGVGDPVGNGWRGRAALLAAGRAPQSVRFTSLAVSGAQTRDVLLGGPPVHGPAVGGGADGRGVAARDPFQRRRTATKRTGVPGTAWAAAGRSAERTTAITG